MSRVIKSQNMNANHCEWKMSKVIIAKYPSIVVDEYIKTGRYCYSDSNLCRNLKEVLDTAICKGNSIK